LLKQDNKNTLGQAGQQGPQDTDNRAWKYEKNTK